MKVFLFLGALLAGTFPSGAQTATADDATASGAKVGTGAESGINAPANVGPRTGPAAPANDVIATPPPEMTPPPAPSAGTGAGSSIAPNPPGAGMTSEGTGTGR